MNARLCCKTCQALAWARVTEDDPDTNSTEFDDPRNCWEGGDPDCPHDDYIAVIVEEDEDDYH